MNRLIELLAKLNKVYSPHRRPDPEPRKILTECVRMIRSDARIYKKLLEYPAFQEIVADKRFSKYLSQVNGFRNPEFVSVMTFKSMSGELPQNFKSRIQISTLPYFERDLAEKLLELHSILKSVPIACQGWKGNLSQDDLARLIGTTARTIRERRRKYSHWRENIQPDPAHPKRWRVKSGMISTFRKEMNS